MQKVKFKDILQFRRKNYDGITKISNIFMYIQISSKPNSLLKYSKTVQK